MRLTADVKSLNSALSLIAPLVKGRTPAPILRCLKLEATKDKLGIYATDRERTLWLETDEVSIDKPGECVIPAERIASIVKLMADEPTLVLETNGDKLSVRGTGSDFEVMGFPAKDYPARPDAGAVKMVAQIAAQELRSRLRVVAPSVGETMEQGYAITGVYFSARKKKLTIITTTGRSLSVCCTDADWLRDDLEGVVVPDKTCETLVKLLADCEEKDTLTISTVENMVVFEIEGTVLTSVLIEGEFVPYEDIIPKKSIASAKVDTCKFVETCRRAALFLDELSPGLRLEFSGGDSPQVVVSGREAEAGTSKVAMPLEEYKGDAMTVGLNPIYFLKTLGQLNSEIKIELTAPNVPVAFRQKKDTIHVAATINIAE